MRISTPLCIDGFQVVKDSGEDRIQGFFATADLLYHLQRTLVGHIEHRLDIQHGAHQRRRVGNASAGLEIVQIVHREAMRDAEFVLLRPGDHIIEAHSFLGAANDFLHEQAEPAGDAPRIQDLQTQFREFAAELFRRGKRIAVGHRHFYGHVQNQYVPARFQKAPEEIVIGIFIDHGGFEPVACAHALINGGAGSLPAVVGA